MMGSTKDPADGKAVAGSVFAAVVVYAVCYTPSELLNGTLDLEITLLRLIRSKLIELVYYRSSSFSAVSRHIYMFGRVRRVLLH